MDARRIGIALADMKDEEVQVAATGIIFKVSVICGCQLPTHDAHINALETEFLIFLNEFGYFNLTVEEILLAFRLNSAFKLSERIEVYGAIFNVDYAGKVLRLYLRERQTLDYKLSEKHREIEADEILEKEANARRTKIKKQFQLFLEGKEELDLADCYMQLSNDGAFYDKHFDETFIEPVKRGYKGDVMARLSDWGERMEKRFKAGKKAVMVLFNAMKDSGKYEIYTEDLTLVHHGFQLPKEEKVEQINDLEF